MNVAILGASDKQERYSYKALMRLRESGHQVFPVHPKLSEIDGISVYPALQDIAESIDTLTVYLSEATAEPLHDAIRALGARRVIFNPGAENPALQNLLKEQGAEVLEACTLVLLATEQF